MMVERVSFDRGVHIRGTPLWFDAETRHEHVILTSMMGRLPPAHKRVLAPMALSNALEKGRYKPAVLPAAWERWVRFGGQEVQFVDLGGPFGTAAALVAGSEKVLVAGFLPQVEDVRWPQADHLVVQLPALQHRGEGPEEVMGGVESFVREALEGARTAAVVVDSVDVGHFVLEALRARGCGARPTGLLARALGESGRSRKEVAVGLVGARSKVGHYAWVDSGLGQNPQNHRDVAPAEVFRLRWYADAEVVKRTVAATGVRRVSVVQGTPADCERLREALGPEVTLRAFSPGRQMEFTH